MAESCIALRFSQLWSINIWSSTGLSRLLGTMLFTT